MTTLLIATAAVVAVSSLSFEHFKLYATLKAQF